jgi:EmrB/QacA subfamily drug resistance transporter
MKRRAADDETRKWLTLAAVSVGLFMILLDNTIVNVAIPSIQRDLGVGLSDLEWIVTGYVLSFASLMLIGGKLADAYGRRRIFIIGLAIFASASLLCGLSQSAGMLVAARVLQGVGAALQSPATLSIITATFPAHQRGTAVGIWAAVAGVSVVLGPLVGGLIVENFYWGWIFLINVPVGIIGIVASLLFVSESRDETHVRLDLPGLATSALGLFTLTYGLIEANTYGWSSPRIVGAFVIAAVSLATFLWLEATKEAPMLDLTLFHSRTFVGSNLTVLLSSIAMYGFSLYVSIYTQNVLGYSPLEAGAVFTPMMLLVILLPPVTGRIADRVGSRWLTSTGMALISVQLFLFSRLGDDASFVNLLPGLLIGGVGVAMTSAPATATAIRSVPVAKAGVGSAVLNSSRQVGGALGVALLGAIVATVVAGRPGPAAFLDGYQAALMVAGAITLVGGALTAVLIPSGRAPGAQTEVASPHGAIPADG